MLETPVLFITFARPEYARQSFNAIKAARPRKLYLYNNIARQDRPDEVERNLQVRSILKDIDWECDVKYFFRTEHVEIYTSIWSAIDWIFDNEEKAIVLEEDCVASLAFFDYCEKMLARYKDEPKIRMISGDNFTPQYNPKGVDYFFSHITNIYGWATWRDRWKSLDREMKDWQTVKDRQLHDYYNSVLMRMWFRLFINRVYKRMPKYHPWDYITVYNMIKCNQCCIVPKDNLCTDIGVIGAHHKIDKKVDIPIIKYNLSDNFSDSNYPSEISPNLPYDFKNFYNNILWRFVKYMFRKYLKL